MTAHRQARNLVRLVGHAIPANGTGQFTAIRLLERHLSRVTEGSEGSPLRVLDFGSGSGDRLPELREVLPAFHYTGIDLRLPRDPRHEGAGVDFVKYDGSRMPFDDGAFDLCFSKQVLEHVRYPDLAVSEIARTLRVGGHFVGSVSFLEPFHAESIFNWSPYGLVTVFEDHGLELVALRPGIDGASLVLRTLYGVANFRRSFARQSMYNSWIETEHADEPARVRNARKLVVAGHLCFLAAKRAP